MKLGPPILAVLLCLESGAAPQSALATMAGAQLVTAYSTHPAVFLSPQEILLLARESVSVREQGQRVRYTGIPLTALLAKSGLRLDERHEKDNLATYILVQSLTDEQVVLALAEVMQPKILIAGTQNGKPLPPSERPYCLIVPATPPRGIGSARYLQSSPCPYRPARSALVG